MKNTAIPGSRLAIFLCSILILSSVGIRITSAFYEPSSEETFAVMDDEIKESLSLDNKKMIELDKKEKPEIESDDVATEVLNIDLLNLEALSRKKNLKEKMSRNTEIAVQNTPAPEIVVQDTPVSETVTQMIPTENTQSADLSPSVPDSATDSDTEMKLSVPAICQYPGLPTGCESVAATMLLQYYGVAVTAEEFARDWLPQDAGFYADDQGVHGPDPNVVFAGNPFSQYSYGCFSGPIVTAINEHCENYQAVSLTGQPLQTLCEEYIQNGNPLLIWATMGMRASKPGRSWYLPDGTYYTWIAGEHCLVLTGYDESYYYLNDPQTGSTVAYERTTVEKRYAELGTQAVVLNPVENIQEE